MDLLNTKIRIAFRASYFNQHDAWYQLKKHDICYRLEGKLGVLFNGIKDGMTISELQTALSTGIITTKLKYGAGYAAVQTLSERYTIIIFDSDGDGKYDSKVHVDITEKTVSTETMAWMVMDL